MPGKALGCGGEGGRNGCREYKRRSVQVSDGPGCVSTAVFLHHNTYQHTQHGGQIDRQLTHGQTLHDGFNEHGASLGLFLWGVSFGAGFWGEALYTSRTEDTRAQPRLGVDDDSSMDGHTARRTL